MDFRIITIQFRTDPITAEEIRTFIESDPVLNLCSNWHGKETLDKLCRLAQTLQLSPEAVRTVLMSGPMVSELQEHMPDFIALLGLGIDSDSVVLESRQQDLGIAEYRKEAEDFIDLGGNPEEFEWALPLHRWQGADYKTIIRYRQEGICPEDIIFGYQWYWNATAMDKSYRCVRWYIEYVRLVHVLFLISEKREDEEYREEMERYRKMRFHASDN